jgi:hypothetical protein
VLRAFAHGEGGTRSVSLSERFRRNRSQQATARLMILADSSDGTRPRSPAFAVFDSSYWGKPIRRSRSAKRGSERRLSHSGCTFRNAQPVRSFQARSSQTNALSLSPRRA